MYLKTWNGKLRAPVIFALMPLRRPSYRFVKVAGEIVWIKVGETVAFGCPDKSLETWWNRPGGEAAKRRKNGHKMAVAVIGSL
jgi:hypothetical protein